VEVHSSAPTRLDLGGGTLDIWPLYLFHPGAQTVNVAIGLRAACTVSSTDDGSVRVHSEDTGHTLTANHWNAIDTTGQNRLLAHLVRFFETDGIQLTTRATSPVGAGIAGSSALTIAVCGALARWRGDDYSSEQLLTLAMNLEARTLGIPTGVQDYRPALHGGVSAVELDPLGVTRVPVQTDTAELQRRLVLVYSGDSRSSGLNNWDITQRHIAGDAALAATFGRIRDIAGLIRDALTRCDWTALASHINLEWQARQALAAGVSTATIDTLMTLARKAGAHAGKVCGAGGGGCIFFLIDPDRRAEVCGTLTDAGAQLLPCEIDTDGLVVESD
jgi:D-glycero-alpha-D-manno-heptose-7-phosphate kinase